MMAELRLDLSKIDSDLEAQYDDQDDMPDDDEECVEDLDPLVDNLSPDDLLSPLEKLQKYFQSDDVGERDIALRIIPDAVQCVSNFAEFDLLLDVVFALASDYEPCIRINVLANLSPLLERNAVLRGEGSEFAPENEERLFGIPVKMLVDINLQVRRASQNFVVSLLEDERGNKGSLLSQLCPMIKRCLGKDENYDLRMDTVLMLGRIAGILGRELIVEHFVPLLPSLALDTMFHVRKAYVMSCRELCPVLGEDDAEEHLLPLFFKLCKDDVWGVRKACADVFTDVSASCNLGTRHDKLTPVYLSLLHDDSRWVRKAAFQSLGAFISTFHVPGTSPDLDDSLPPLSDSFLDTEQLSTSSTGQSTSDPTTTTGKSTSDPSTTSSTGQSTSDPSTTGKSTSDPSTTSSTGKSTSDPSITNSNGQSTSDPSSAGKSTSDPSTTSSTGKSTSDPSITNSTGQSTSDPSSAGKSTSDPSGTGKSTSDPSIETRHTESTNANVNSSPEDPQEEVTFVPSEIARTSSQELLEKSLQDMTVEDLELLESSPLDKDHDLESSPLDKGHDLCADESEENDILDSAIKKIGVQSPLTLDEPLVIHPPPIKSVKLDGEAEAANNETDNNTRDDMHSQSDNNGNRGPILVGGEEQTSHPDYARPSGEISKHSRLVELLQDDNARIRCSSEGSSFKSYFDPVLRGEMGSTSKKRRWSLDKNNTTSQVRVFIHSVSGKVMEQDLSDHAPLSPDTPTDRTHNATTTNSVAMDITLDGMESSIPCDPNMFSDFGQEVVPDELMESYLSMTEQVKAQVVDTDLPYYCAYSLAGVALTLGQEYWDIVRPTFSLLASDMQWRIRRVLSFCLHELAKVVGEERMVGDILPVFEEYCTKDIDDVKIGALSHLAEFFELLPSALRSRHLPAVLHGLQDMENEKNWRYRNLLAEQLVLLCDLFDCDYLEHHVYPVALALAEDKVAEVRATATLVLGVILQKLSHMDLNKCRAILHQLRSYGSNEKWLYRLMYVKQCETFLLDGRISCELFASECLPILLQLARDKVPNVRIAVARMIKESVLKIDYFQTENKETFSLEELQITLECLQHDQDRDVKFFAGGEVSDTRRLLMLPVQWYAQRQRSESNHSHNSNEQYQDALEDQSDSKPRPLSLTMAGVLVKSLQKNHKKSPTTNYGSVDAPKTDENATQDTAVKSEEGPQDTTVESQDTVTDTQDTTVEPQDTIVGTQDTTLESQDTVVGTQDTTVEPQDTIVGTQDTTMEPQDTIVGTQDTTVEPQDTIVGTQDTTVEPQDTIVGTQDTTVEPQDVTVACRDNFETTASTSDSNYATDGPPLVDNNNIAKNLNTSLDNSEGTV